jgi:hypothetical protein
LTCVDGNRASFSFEAGWILNSTWDAQNPEDEYRYLNEDGREQDEEPPSTDICSCCGEVRANHEVMLRKQTGGDTELALAASAEAGGGEKTAATELAKRRKPGTTNGGAEGTASGGAEADGKANEDGRRTKAWWEEEGGG